MVQVRHQHTYANPVESAPTRACENEEQQGEQEPSWPEGKIKKKKKKKKKTKKQKKTRCKKDNEDEKEKRKNIR